MGREYIIHFDIGKTEVVARIDASKPVLMDDAIYVKVDTAKARIYDSVSTLLIN